MLYLMKPKRSILKNTNYVEIIRILEKGYFPISHHCCFIIPKNKDYQDDCRENLKHEKKRQGNI